MDFIIDFLTQVRDFFTSIYFFLIQLVQSLKTFISVFWHAVNALPAFTRLYSGVMLSWFVGIIALCIVFRILGREG